MQKITFSCDYFRREEDFNAYHDLPVQYRQWADYEAHPVYREVFKQILQQTAEESIKDSWSCEEETPQFLTKLFRQYKERIVPRTLPFSKICEACSTLERTYGGLRARSESCDSKTDGNNLRPLQVATQVFSTV